jgi:hypothetical protein
MRVVVVALGVLLVVLQPRAEMVVVVLVLGMMQLLRQVVQILEVVVVHHALKIPHQQEDKADRVWLLSDTLIRLLMLYQLLVPQGGQTQADISIIRLLALVQ